ncbi:phage tail tape measure protein [Streptomyces sp. NBC_01754]|uniref:phage tail tape measure protein n=1 Tax=Streptomyces sp. NBC_01754 TaxID=2975930 RepID=UPI002DDC1641|nr:phage tail tape measure protein [Streptomyces sp. NBC_01754]WSC93008.1 phage tail tape measure protein [Streptomyces sp. NBC_01754]
MALRVGELFASLRMDDSAFRQGLTSARQGLASTGETATNVGRSLTTGVSLPLAGVAGAALKMGGDFQASMNGVRAVTGATGKDFDDLRDMAKRMGAETQFSATDAAGAMEFLGMTGWKTNEIMSGLPDVLNLAAAGNTDLAKTADIASNMMSGFGIEASDTARVADVLAQTMRSANVDLEMLGESMNYASPVANAAGWSFEETAAAVGMLGNAGIQGSNAGTGLNSVLATLASTTSTGGRKLKEFGVAATGANGKVRPLTDIMDDLQKKGADVADVIDIFGLEAGPKLQALIGQGSKGLRELIKDLTNSGGVAKEMADIRMEGFNGSIKGLKSAFEGLMIAIADSGLLEWAEKFATKLTGVISKLTQTDSSTLRLVTVIGMVVASVGPLLLIFGKIVSLFSGAITGLAKFGRAARTAATAIRAMSAAMFANPIGLIVLGIIALIAALVVAYKKVEWFRDIVDSAWSKIKVAFEKFMVAAQPIFDALKELFGQVGDSASQMWTTVQPHLVELGRLFQSIFGKIGDAVQGFVQFAQDLWARWGENILGMVRGAWGVISSEIMGALGIIQGVIQVFTSLITGDWSGAWDGIKKIFSSAWDMIGGILSGALEFLQNLLSIAWDAISYAASKAWDKILDFFKAIPGRIAGFFSNWSLPGIIARHWQSIKDGTARKAGEMLAYVKGLPGRIIGYFGNFGGMLVGKGRDLIRGLWEGIKGMGGWLAGQLSSFAKSAIPGPIAKALGIHSPSTLMRDQIGRWIPAGIIDGIEAGAGALDRTMQSLVTPPALPSLAPAMAGGGSPGLSYGSSSPTIHIENWHAAEHGSPDDNARSLDWLSKGRG